MSRLRSRVQLVGAAVLFSTGGAAIKSCSLSSWQVASLRSLVAAVVIFALLPAARQRVNRRSVWVACAYAATLVLFVCANKLTTAASAIFLQSTAPLYLVLLGPLLLGEPVGREEMAFFGTLALGCGLLLLGGTAPSTSAPNPKAGNLLGALSGVTWALTVLGLRWTGRAEAGASAASAVLVGNLIAVVACLPMALPFGHPRLSDWLLLGYLGVFQIGAAYALVTAAIRHVSALEAALLLLVEPALNPVWAWLIHAERPGPVALAGGVLILLATGIKSWTDLRAATVAPRAR